MGFPKCKTNCFDLLKPHNNYHQIILNYLIAHYNHSGSLLQLVVKLGFS